MDNKKIAYRYLVLLAVYRIIIEVINGKESKEEAHYTI